MGFLKRVDRVAIFEAVQQSDTALERGLRRGIAAADVFGELMVGLFDGRLEASERIHVVGDDAAGWWDTVFVTALVLTGKGTMRFSPGPAAERRGFGRHAGLRCDLLGNPVEDQIEPGRPAL